MTGNLPTSRYKIIERDRRLVTIDTLTGAEVGTKAQSPSPTVTERDSAEASARTSALSPTVKAVRPDPVSPSSDKSGRIGILIAAGIAGAIFLFFTGAWIVVAIALAIPPIRTAAFVAIKLAVRRFLNPER